MHPQSPPAEPVGSRRGRLRPRSGIRSLAFLLALPVVAIAVACEGDDDPLPLPLSSPDVTTTTAATSGENAMTVDDDGFAPDSLTVPMDTQVVITNETESDLLLSVDGDGSSKSLEIEVPAGESIALSLPGRGAYVITSPTDPSLTATVMVV